ncbi:MAG: PAS domain-containing sensor histidine kinase [Myxococcales bacterium]|nr:PAS domain-containing sensor histidine kinase [Myxococcales bacterium]
MQNGESSRRQTADLRRRAKTRLCKSVTAIEGMTREEIERSMHDLEVHQVELEIQNEELRRTQIELLVVKDKYIALYENAPNGYMTIDSTGRVLKANLTVERLLGVRRSQLIELPFHFFLRRAEKYKLEQHLAEVFKTGTQQSCEIEIGRLKTGNLLVRMESVAVVSDGDGFRECHVSLFDISARRQAELELIRHRDQLEVLVAERTQELAESRLALYRADRLASLGTLAAGLAHELNNPLGIIRLRADEALLDDDLTACKIALEYINEQVERSAEIVAGVLRFSREKKTEYGKVDLADIVLRSIDFVRHYAICAKVQLVCQVEEGPAFVMGSASELEQVVVNLIRNAIEASDCGDCVSIALPRLRNLIRLTVSDEGIGMTDEVREHAFDPFYTTRRDSGGTGLGLSVAHGIARQHNGSINIQSQVGKGTTIALELAVYDDEVDSGANPGAD